MKTLYTNMDIHFTIENIAVHALNIIFERFTRTIPSHSHGDGCYEIHYISSGYGKLNAAGVYYDIEPGTLYVTGPHIEHAQTPIASDPMQEYCVYLKTDSNVKFGEGDSVMGTFLSKPFWFGRDTQGIQGLMNQLFEELEHCYIGYQHQVRLLLSQLLIYVVRNYGHHRVSRSSFTRSNLSDSKFVIIEEYFLYEYAALSLDSLADRLKVSPRQAQRFLARYYGKTFQEKKAEARMSAAAILLMDRERTITAVAEELGYASSEHFSSAFRQFYGMSPREYRKAAQSGNV